MNYKKYQNAFLISLLLVFNVCVLVFNDLLQRDNQGAYSILASAIAILSVIILFYLLYSISHNALEDARQEAELQTLKAQQEIRNQQNEVLARRRQQTLMLQQDMKQKLEVYASLMKNEKYVEAARCIDALTSSFQKERFRPVCSNNLINAILDTKRQIADRDHIQTTFQILFPSKIKIENSDLSSIFFNLMDNGIEACRNSHAEHPFLHLSAGQNANFLTIHMVNSKDPAYKFDHKTNKTDSWSHGFGLAIIEDIAARYDGTCQWTDNGDTFDSIVMIRTE